MTRKQRKNLDTMRKQSNQKLGMHYRKTGRASFSTRQWDGRKGGNGMGGREAKGKIALD